GRAERRPERGSHCCRPAIAHRVADTRSRHGVSAAAAAHEHQIRYTETRVAGDDPAKTIEQPSDDRVVRRDGGDEAVETTLLRRIEQHGEERGADALSLPVVLN